VVEAELVFWFSVRHELGAVRSLVQERVEAFGLLQVLLWALAELQLLALSSLRLLLASVRVEGRLDAGLAVFHLSSGERVSRLVRTAVAHAELLR